MTVTARPAVEEATAVAATPRQRGTDSDRPGETSRAAFILGPLAIVCAYAAIIIGRDIDELGSVLLRAVLVTAWAGAGMALFSRPVLRRLATLVLWASLLASVGLVAAAGVAT